MFTLLSSYQINLGTGWRKCSVWRTLFFDSKQKHFGYIPKIKSNTATIRLPIFAYLFPNDITFILKSPCIHNSKTVRQHCIWDP